MVEAMAMHDGMQMQPKLKGLKLRKSPKAPAPLERVEQIALFDWLHYVKTKQGDRIGSYAFAIPNGSWGGSNRVAAAIHGKSMVRQGVRRGVPDVCIAIPQGPWHGLWIELKRVGGAKPGPEQIEWHAKLASKGYCMQVCYGVNAAKRVIEMYFGLER